MFCLKQTKSKILSTVFIWFGKEAAVKTSHETVFLLAGLFNNLCWQILRKQNNVNAPIAKFTKHGAFSFW